MPIEQDSDRTVHLFGIGDRVGTPEGDGTIIGIDFIVGEYPDSTQLEPPSILVELRDGRRIHTCMCALDLGSDAVNEFVGSEFDRLWPPMTSGVPADAESTIPEGEEDTMQRQANEETPYTIEGQVDSILTDLRDNDITSEESDLLLGAIDAALADAVPVYYSQQIEMLKGYDFKAIFFRDVSEYVGSEITVSSVLPLAIYEAIRERLYERLYGLDSDEGEE